MTVYYNENNPEAAAVLRFLAAENIIAPGHVDDRSIKDVTANDLKGYAQHHFFAGAGLWSIACRTAGWPDHRSIWSASCPCQPLSVAGKRLASLDPRHLWPDLFRLIRDARAAGFGPPVIVGEQVSGAAGYGWFDGVCADLAAENYAGRALDAPACAIDSPQQRNRLWWFAASAETLEHASCYRRHSGASTIHVEERWNAAAADDRQFGLLGGAEREGLEGHAGDGDDRSEWPVAARSAPPSDGRNGTYWSDWEWLICHDGKARRTKPGVRLLVNGMVGRADLWSLAGNSIVPQFAAEVIAAVDEVLREAA